MVTVVIIGIDQWEQYTRPLIASIRKHEPNVSVVLVDNGSKQPYPAGDYELVRLDKTVSYAEAINAGMPSYGWAVVLNNDVLISKPFVKQIEDLPTFKLYGFYVHEIFKRKYLSGWALFISEEVRQVVGEFDKEFRPMYLEDADYSFRCCDVGYYLHLLDREIWGFKHLERGGERRVLSEKHAKDIERNRIYLKGKHGL